MQTPILSGFIAVISFNSSSIYKNDAVRHFFIDININNEGYEPFKSKDGAPYMRYNFTSNKNIVPKFRNKRINNIIKAYNLQYKW